jgi:hypothetical protein
MITTFPRTLSVSGQPRSTWSVMPTLVGMTDADESKF